MIKCNKTDSVLETEFRFPISAVFTSWRETSRHKYVHRVEFFAQIHTKNHALSTQSQPRNCDVNYYAFFRIIPEGIMLLSYDNIRCKIKWSVN